MGFKLIKSCITLFFRYGSSNAQQLQKMPNCMRAIINKIKQHTYLITLQLHNKKKKQEQLLQLQQNSSLKHKNDESIFQSFKRCTS